MAIKYTKTAPVSIDGIYQTLKQVDGKIIKILIKSSIRLPNVSVDINTMDGENIFSALGLLEGVLIDYPMNVIRVMKDNFDGEHLDYYYSKHALNVHISGLEEGQRIDDIVIYYKE